jgi:hypothetical protein
MWEHRQRAAGGGRPVPTRDGLRFRVLSLMNGWMVLMPLRQLFPDRQRRLLVAELVDRQLLNFRPDGERRMRLAPEQRSLRVRAFRSPSTELQPGQAM